jgi:hypothetical protein
LKEKDTQARIEALIALARMNKMALSEAPTTEKKPAPGSSSGAVPAATAESSKPQALILEALASIDFTKLDTSLQLQLLRAYQLAFTRMGKPDAATCSVVAANLDPVFPSKNASVNRELTQLLVFLDSKTVVAKTLGLVATAADDSDALASDELLARNAGYARAAEEVHKSRPNKQQIALMWSLRNATAGWTPELKKTYFSWFPHARTWKGGNSFKGFIENARKEALALFGGAETAELDALSSKNEVVPADFVAPKGPGHNWTIDEVVALTKGGLK